MAKKPMWMVRADEGGRRFDEFESQGMVAIGWSEMADMSGLKTREDFARAVEKAWPGMKKMQAAISTGQSFRFVREIKVGDRVLTYDPSARSYLVGTITGEYRYDQAQRNNLPNRRAVSWDGRVPGSGVGSL